MLGPLEVIHNDTAAAPSGAKERAILARLLLEPARVVAADALLEAAWPGADPRAVTRSLGVRLANLRAFLEPARPAGRPSTLLVRDGHGYRLVADPEQVDAVRLERLVRDATTLAPADALTRYETALALWRGAPFGDLAYAEFAQAEIRRLEELRVRAAEGRARALVELGRHEDALPELQRLAAAEPLREELARALALALYRCGRQVDALAALRALGTDLSALGLEPSTDTRDARARDPPARQLARVPGAGRPAAAEARAAASSAARRTSRTPRSSSPRRRWSRSPAPAAPARRGWRSSWPAGTRTRGGASWRRWRTTPTSPAPIAEVLGDADHGLLVLDNCEHVLDGAADAVEELLARSPDLHILATSRAPLGVDGEQVLRLCGLEPAGAVDLFVDRARAADGIVDRPRDRRAVPAARRPAAGDRARGRPHALDGARRDRRAARRAVQPADGAGPPRGRPPLDPARRDRLVVRAARRAAAAAVRAAVGVRARLRARRRGGGVRGRRRRPRAGGVAARRAGVQLAGRRSGRQWADALLPARDAARVRRRAAGGARRAGTARRAPRGSLRHPRAADDRSRLAGAEAALRRRVRRAARRRAPVRARRAAGPGVHARRGAVVAGALPPRGGDCAPGRGDARALACDPPAATAGARGGFGRPAGGRRRGGRAAARRCGARARGRSRRGRAAGPPHAREDRVLRR